MAKTKQTKTILCNNCKHFDGTVCVHPSNLRVFIRKKTEKVIYKNTELKTDCKEYVEL